MATLIGPIGEYPDDIALVKMLVNLDYVTLVTVADVVHKPGEGDSLYAIEFSFAPSAGKDQGPLRWFFRDARMRDFEYRALLRYGVNRGADEASAPVAKSVPANDGELPPIHIEFVKPNR